MRFHLAGRRLTRQSHTRTACITPSFSTREGGFFMPQISLSDAYELFKLDMKARRCEQSTLEFYEWFLGQFLTWCDQQNITQIGAISSTHIKQFIVSLQERELSDYTQKACASAVRAFLNYCVRDELLTESPFKKIKMPVVDEDLLPALTPDEVKQVWKACRTPLERTIVLVLLDSGVRAAELLSLNGGDISLDTGEIKVRKGKGKRGRTTYIGAKALKQVRKYYIVRGIPGPDEAVFLARDGSGKRFCRSSLFKTIKRIGKRAGVEHCTCHAFRRTFCLESLRSGMDIFHLARLSGHKNLDVLKRYLDLVKADLRAAQEKHGVVSKLID
jgi:site-specific recombinase XerD